MPVPPKFQDNTLSNRAALIWIKAGFLKNDIEYSSNRATGKPFGARFKAQEGADMRILVSVDGSASANRAAAYALLLADGRADAEITLVNVQNQRTLDTSDISSVMSVGADTDLAVDQSEKALRKAIQLCRNAQVKFDARSAFGPTAETIIRIAREVKADQIVMGTRGLGPLRGLALGSVSTKVVRLSRIPVTLVK
jgi:nucleotide-binding universal stress UspA family protein